MLVLSVGALALVTSAAAFILYFDFRADVSAYRSTPACVSPGDAATMDCRYAGPAQILSSSRTDQLRVNVRFAAVPEKSFSARFPKNGEPRQSVLTTGATIDGELWSGKISRLAGTPTSDNPESTSPDSVLPFGWAFLVSALVVFAMSAALARHYSRLQAWPDGPAGKTRGGEE